MILILVRVFAVLTCLAVSTLALAERPSKPGAGKGQPNRAKAGTGQQAGNRFAENPAARMLKAAQQLTSLTPQQRSELAALEQKIRGSLTSLQSEMHSRRETMNASSPEQKRAVMQELRPKMQRLGQEVHSGIQTILTPEQRTELAAAVGQQQGRQMKNAEPGGGAHGPGAAGVPQSMPGESPPVNTRPVVAAPAADNATSSPSAMAQVNPFTP